MQLDTVRECECSQDAGNVAIIGNCVRQTHECLHEIRLMLLGVCVWDL